MKQITLLKLGGSLITDKTKPFTAKMDIIRDLAVQIKKALDTNPHLHLIIGNGAGSFAHYPAVQYNIKNGITREEQKLGFCEVQDAASRLNRIIVHELIKAKVRACSLNPSSMLVAQNGEIKNFFLDPIFGFLNLNIIPVLYGDIVFDEKRGAKIYSTEQLLSYIAQQLQKKGYSIERIVHNGITKGVLDGKNNPIPKITQQNFKIIKKHLNSTRGFDVTGGMSHKVEESLKLADKGIKSLIINGASQKELLTKALLGEKVFGTVIQ